MHKDRFKLRLCYICITRLIQGAEDELKHAVAMVRPVSVAFQVMNGFRFYDSGVYTSDTCGSSTPWWAFPNIMKGTPSPSWSCLKDVSAGMIKPSKDKSQPWHLLSIYRVNMHIIWFLTVLYVLHARRYSCSSSVNWMFCIRMWAVLFSWLVMKLKMAFCTGSSRISRERTGATTDTSKWRWGQTCVVSSLHNSTHRTMLLRFSRLFQFMSIHSGLNSLLSYSVHVYRSKLQALLLVHHTLLRPGSSLKDQWTCRPDDSKCMYSAWKIAPPGGGVQ